MFRILAGLSVHLPPETLLEPMGMGGPNQPDTTTMLRGAYAMGNTPMIFNAMLPGKVEEIDPGLREQFLHYDEKGVSP